MSIPILNKIQSADFGGLKAPDLNLLKTSGSSCSVDLMEKTTKTSTKKMLALPPRDILRSTCAAVVNKIGKVGAAVVQQAKEAGAGLAATKWGAAILAGGRKVLAQLCGALRSLRSYFSRPQPQPQPAAEAIAVAVVVDKPVVLSDPPEAVTTVNTQAERAKEINKRTQQGVVAAARAKGISSKKMGFQEKQKIRALAGMTVKISE
jgi:hypothetical protein